MAPSNTTAPPNTKSLSISGMKAKRVVVFIVVITIAVANCGLSAFSLGSSQFFNDAVRDAANAPANTASGDLHPHRWTHNITDFPAFMLQWPTDIFEPHQCNFMNSSMAHTFSVTDYPRSYSLDDTLHVDYGNLTEALDQAGAMTDGGDPTNPWMNGRTPSNHITTVICAKAMKPWIFHFPHLLQNLLPCWSLWRLFPDVEHVFLLGPEFKPEHVHITQFNEGIFALFQANNITVSYERSKPYINHLKTLGKNILVAKGNLNYRSGYRAIHEDDLQHFRRSTMSMLGMEHYITQSCGVSSLTELTAKTNAETSDRSTGNQHLLRPPRIGIATRTASRRVHGAHNISSLLQDELDLKYRPPVFLMESLSFEEQVELFANVDILLTPHGAHLTGVPFMPRCGSVIELLPYGYDWNEFFGTLTAMSGLNHSYIYLGEDPVAETRFFHKRNRDQEVRSADICVPAHRVIEAVKIQVDHWHQCCGSAP